MNHLTFPSTLDSLIFQFGVARPSPTSPEVRVVSSGSFLIDLDKRIRSSFRYSPSAGDQTTLYLYNNHIPVKTTILILFLCYFMCPTVTHPSPTLIHPPHIHCFLIRSQFLRNAAVVRRVAVGDIPPSGHSCKLGQWARGTELLFRDCICSHASRRINHSPAASISQ